MAKITPNKTKSRLNMEVLNDLQKQLDEAKYYSSIEAKRDMSGCMPYCNGCKHRVMQVLINPGTASHCAVEHDVRSYNLMCAKHLKEMSNE